MRVSQEGLLVLALLGQMDGSAKQLIVDTAMSLSNGCTTSDPVSAAAFVAAVERHAPRARVPAADSPFVDRGRVVAFKARPK
jgi:hypothetical protein